MVDDPGVGGDEGDAEHERDGHADPLVEAGIGPVEDGAVAHAGAVGSDGVEEEGTEDRSGDGADGQGVDAEHVGEAELRRRRGRGCR